MRNDASFKSFYDSGLTKSKNHLSISEPTLPRKRHTPIRFEIGTGETSYPTTTFDYYKRIYYEAVDLMVNTIDQRFNQPSFVTYATMEAFLIKVLKSEDCSTELQIIETNYADDVVSGTLKAQLEIFKILMKG